MGQIKIKTPVTIAWRGEPFSRYQDAQGGTYNGPNYETTKHSGPDLA